ncbi:MULTISPECIES: acyltransferase [unclassified Campylobacter]|uniref:acyltransferase n=1 Tax=unclassified Campylobacter TaxID=2593542 RepID=UPI0022E9D8B8|nr:MULTISPECIES: acyltransferase [unclassified Campylobacter]MDA3061843.1 acyltransferase [Campylobacter sp. JMF_14 EL1]MDA3073051.1 acyltransferase [Campylobacter sp. JMF_10 EL2]
MLKRKFKNFINRLRGEVSTEWLVAHGMKVGRNFARQTNVILDPHHCHLIEIGDNVTLAPQVYILAHDASTQMFLGRTKTAPVKIGNRVFIGARSLIMPGVSIGDNVVIGAGSLVTKDIPSNSLAFGSPAKVVNTLDDYLEKMKIKNKW